MNRLWFALTLLIALLHAPRVLADAPAQKMRWVGQDAQGQPLEVPVPNQPTVIIFLRPGQAPSEREIAQVRQDLLDAHQLRIFGIISGPQSRQRAAALDPSQWTWPLLLDDTYAASGAFEVHAWPTTIIFDAQGNMAGRIAGCPLNLKASLSAYIAYATGSITRDQLDDQLTQQQIVQDSADQKASRHLLLVQQFLASGRPEEALAQLHQAQELAPASESLRLRMARALLSLGQTKQADDLLATVETTTQPTELSLLRARAAIAFDRWPEARQHLLDAQAADPTITTQPELHYLLGLIDQHDRNYSEAAQSFRKAFESTLPTPATRPQ